jgi:hypothetical protein
MKSIKRILLAATAIISLAACKKTTTTEEPQKKANSAKVTVYFTNEVDGQSLELGQMKYTNAKGNMYQVDLLKYYICNIVFVKSDNTEVAVDNYDLVNAAEPLSGIIEAANIPNGTYTKVKFNVGVPPSRNHTGAQDGDLDPSKGMFWTWSTGYIFFKHEGKYKDNSSATKSLVFHYATDRALASVELPVSGLVVDGTEKKLRLKFNLNKLYTTPTDIDFNVDNNHQSMSSADYPWIDNLKESFSDAFIFDKVE